MKIKRLSVAIPLLAALCSPSFRLSAQETATDPVRLSVPYHQAHFSTLALHGGFKYWDKGFLITYANMDSTIHPSPNTPAVILYDREGDGRVAQEAVVWFKEAARLSVGHAAVTKSGKLLVTGGTGSHDGAIANFIVSIGTDGRIDRVIRTTPFLPIYICSAADDGTVWSYGFDRDEHGRWIRDSLRLRQYSFDKGEIRKLLEPSVLDSAWSRNSRGAYPGAMGMRCNSQKIVLYNGNSTQLIEFDLAADKLNISKAVPLPENKSVRITGFALTDSGDMFVSLHDRAKDPPLSGLFKLTFKGTEPGTWQGVEGTVGPFLQGSVAFLMGASGNDLLYTKQLFDGQVYWSNVTPKK